MKQQEIERITFETASFLAQTGKIVPGYESEVHTLIGNVLMASITPICRQRDELLAILERVIHLIDDAAVNGYITVPTVPLERWHGPIADARDVLAAAAIARARSGGVQGSERSNYE